MGILRIEAEPASLRELSLPVEVRRSSFALVRRAMTNDEIELQAGEYHLVAELPSGATLYGNVQVGASDTSTVRLALEDAGESADDDRSAEALLTPPRRSAKAIDGAPCPEVTVRVLRGNVLDPASMAGAEELEEGYVLIPLALDWDEKRESVVDVEAGRRRLARVNRAGAAPLNLLLPTSPRYGCSLRLSCYGPEEPIGIQVIPGGRAAAAALGYEAVGVLSGAAGVAAAKATGAAAEQLVARKDLDPVGAVIGAYTLLRMGELARLRDWTANLFGWFEWMPDAAVVHAEFLARRGKHRQALDALLTLPARGVPVFSEGLGMAANRLRHYVGLLQRPAKRQGAVMDLLERLSRFERWADPHLPFTAYPGEDATMPGQSRAHEGMEFNLRKSSTGAEERMLAIADIAEEANFTAG
jgi:hypothetical protein